MERPKYRYHLAFQCTHKGHFRANMTYYVSASSEAEAKRLVKENYPDAKAFRVISKWENTPRNASKAKESAAIAEKAKSVPKAAKTAPVAAKTSNVTEVDPEEIIRSIWSKRKAEMVRLQKQLEVSHSQKLYTLTCDYEAQRKKLNKELELAEKTIAEESAHRKSLGLFKFEERKSVKKEITRLQEQREKISEKLKDLEANLHAEKMDLEKEKKAESKMLYQRVKENIPAPTSESKFVGYDQLPIEQAVRYTRLIYLLSEMEPGKRYTITDMQSFPKLAQCSNSAITSLLRLPAAQSHTVRTVERGRLYYTLTIPQELR